MRILVVTEVFPPGLGGVQVFIERLVNQLGEAGDEVIVLTNSETTRVRSYSHTMPSGIKVVRVPAVASFINPSNNRMAYNPWRTTNRIFATFKPDCVHMHTPAGLLHDSALKQARRRGVPVVVTNHVMPENMAMNMHPSISKHAAYLARRFTVGFINKTDFLVAPTQTALDLLGPTVAIPKRAITNGIDVRMYSPGKKNLSVLEKFGIPGDSRIILYTGRLDGEKRIDILLSAFTKLSSDFPDTRLVIVGAGLLDGALRQQAKRSVASARIIFTGRVTDEEKISLLRSATIFAMPSPAELQCISALEALSCGVPIVAADQAALVELVRPSENGYFFTYPSVDDCAHSLRQLLESPIDTSTLDKNTRQWILKDHDQEITVKRYRELFAQLSKSHQ